MRTQRTYWFIAKTKWGRERYARANVMRQGVTLATFLPVIEGHRGKEEYVFPGYLFFKTYGQFLFIENTYGCTGVIKIGEHAAEFYHRDMKALRLRVRDQQVIVTRELEEKHRVRYAYAPKQRVKMVGDSQYKGIEGLYSHTSPEKRICILLSLLGRVVLVEQDARDVVGLDPEVAAA